MNETYDNKGEVAKELAKSQAASNKAFDNVMRLWRKELRTVKTPTDRIRIDKKYRTKIDKIEKDADSAYKKLWDKYHKK
jgi:hypothetical protein